MKRLLWSWDGCNAVKIDAMNRVYLLLGSNMGNRQQMLDDAVALLIENLLPDYLEVEDLSDAVNTSSVYETEPWGFESSSKFLNQAFVCLTDKSAGEVLDICLGIEKELGRERSGEQFNAQGERVYSSRVIDIDILLFDSCEEGKYVPQTVNEVNLQIPHPRMQERMFVLEPLCEVAKDYVHPVLGKTVGILKKELKKSK